MAPAGLAPAGTDLSRVIGMVLIHDLVEIDAGDLFLYADPSAQERQEIAERAAADRIFAILPADQAAAMRRFGGAVHQRRPGAPKLARAPRRPPPAQEDLACRRGT